MTRACSAIWVAIELDGPNREKHAVARAIIRSLRLVGGVLLRLGRGDLAAGLTAARGIAGRLLAASLATSRRTHGRGRAPASQQARRDQRDQERSSCGGGNVHRWNSLQEQQIRCRAVSTSSRPNRILLTSYNVDSFLAATGRANPFATITYDFVARGEAGPCSQDSRRKLVSAASNQMSETSPQGPDRLVAGCRAGDRDSQRQLYDACSPRVYRLAVRMVGVQDAADVTQQTFLRAFSRLNQYDGNARFETWLYRLAVNESLQHLRRRRRWDQPSSLDYDPADTSRRCENTEQRELLDQALARLEPQLRSIFLLRESEELTYREIAEALEIPAGTVGSRLNRARRALQEHLTALGWTP